MACRRRAASLPATAALPDDEDLLVEILVRLPPQPTSLLRAAAVCRRWRRLVTDPRFLRRFRGRRRAPPLLGFFRPDGSFAATQDPRGRALAARAASGFPAGWDVVGCRHGLVLCRNWGKHQYLVFEPVSGHRSAGVLVPQVALPRLLTVAVVGVPGSIDRLSFRLVALSADDGTARVSASVYSSDAGVWADSVATLVSRALIGFIRYPGTLVGNAIYWLDNCGRILQYDLGRQALCMTALPRHTEAEFDFRFQIAPAAGDGCFGVTVFDEPAIQFWERDANLVRAANWVLRKTVRLDTSLPLGLEWHLWSLQIIGFDEENDVLFLRTHIGTFMVQLASFKFRKVSEETNIGYIYPYSSF